MFSINVPYLFFISIFICCFISTSASISSEEKSAIPGPNAIQNEIINDVVIDLKLDTTTILTPALIENVTKANDCFHADTHICHEKEAQECFHYSPKNDSIVCCHVTDIDRILSSITHLSNNSVKNVHIINASLEELDLGKHQWKLLNSLAVTDGKIKRINGNFAKMSSPICLNFSNNNIFDISGRSMIHLNHLQILDVSFNNLTTLPKVPINITVDIK